MEQRCPTADDLSLAQAVLDRNGQELRAGRLRGPGKGAVVLVAGALL